MDNVDFYLEDLRSKFKKIKCNEWYLSYSGGRDSHLLWWFIKEYAKEYSGIEVIGINTYMEHPEIRDRIHNNCDKVLLPSKKPFEIKERYGIPCFSKEQDFYIYYYQKAIREGREPAKTYVNKIMGTYRTGYGLSKRAREYVLSGEAHDITHLCCYYLKKKPAHDFEKMSGKRPILGVRGEESALRKRQYNSCFSGRAFTPIWDLTDELLEAIYSKWGIETPRCIQRGVQNRLYGLSLWELER